MAKRERKAPAQPAAEQTKAEAAGALGEAVAAALPAPVAALVESGALVPASQLAPRNPTIGATSDVDRRTGEVTEGPSYLRDELWAHSGARLTPEQQQALMRPVSEDEVEIKPDSFGAVYLSHAGYRRRLIEAFGMGGWFLRPLDKPRYDEERGVISWHYALIADGRTMGQAVGEQQYHPDGDMTYGDALEGAKSNALMRCCKDLGVALELWERRVANGLRDRLGIKVMIERRGQRKVAWRRLDDAPIWGEVGLASDSPNRDRASRAPEDRPAAAAAAAPAPTAEPSITEAQATTLKAEMEEVGVTPGQVKAWLKTKHGVEVTSAKSIPARLYEATLGFVAAQESAE